MGRFRFSLAKLCGLVTFAAVGAAALANPTLLWVSTFWSLTVGMLVVALLGAAYSRGDRRAYWSGFCLVGWGRLVLVFAPWFEDKTGEWSLGRQALDALAGYLGHGVILPGYVRGIWETVVYQPRYSHLAFVFIGQLLLTLVFAYAGGLLARWFYLRREADR